MSNPDHHVRTSRRLAQWTVDFLPSSSFSYRKSDPFRIGLWNWYLSVERNKQVFVKLYPEVSRTDRPPVASFVVSVTLAPGRRRRSLVHPGVLDKMLKSSEDFVWEIETNLVSGRFVIDVQFKNLKIIPSPGGEPSSIWSPGTASTGGPASGAVVALFALHRMLAEGVHTDITFHAADGKAIKAHRAVLASRSPVFQSMFSHDLREKVHSAVHLPDMSSAACRAFLGYLYGALDPEDFWANRLPLLRAADKYDVEDLREACEESLAEDLDSSNVLERLQTAHAHGLRVLKDGCMRYLVEFGKICEVREELNGFLLAGDRELVAEVFREVLAAWKGF